LTNYTDDFVNRPSNDVLFNALDCLIIAAGQHRWSIVCPFLLDQITNTLRTFRHNVVSLIQSITVVCDFFEEKLQEFKNIKWLDQTSCSLLQFLSILDNENNIFAIDRLLVKIAFFNHQLLSSSPTTFKDILLDKNTKMNS
ncbi:unnamed protein product, partial [Rotaria sp. Silwood1]